jgi:hypothetical protein
MQPPALQQLARRVAHVLAGGDEVFIEVEEDSVECPVVVVPDDRFVVRVRWDSMRWNGGDGFFGSSHGGDDGG